MATSDKVSREISSTHKDLSNRAKNPPKNTRKMLKLLKKQLSHIKQILLIVVQIRLQRLAQRPAPTLSCDCFKIETGKQNVPKFIKTMLLKNPKSIYSRNTQQNIDTQTELQKQSRAISVPKEDNQAFGL